jgi:hypothetical protein
LQYFIPELTRAGTDGNSFFHVRLAYADRNSARGPAVWGSQMTKLPITCQESANAFRYDSAVGHYSEWAAFGELVLVGAIDEDGAALLQSDVHALLARTDVAGLVVDLRCASVNVNSMPCKGADMRTPPQRICPVAFVVPPSVEFIFLQWAWDMTRAGFARGAFTRTDDAREWVRCRSAAMDVLRSISSTSSATGAGGSKRRASSAR